MPINALKKNTARGNGPPSTSSTDKPEEKVLSAEEKQKESELAALEIEAMWESQEEGLVRWSENDGKRFAD